MPAAVLRRVFRRAGQFMVGIGCVLAALGTVMGLQSDLDSLEARPVINARVLAHGTLVDARITERGPEFGYCARYEFLWQGQTYRVTATSMALCTPHEPVGDELVAATGWPMRTEIRINTERPTKSVIALEYATSEPSRQAAIILTVGGLIAFGIGFVCWWQPWRRRRKGRATPR